MATVPALESGRARSTSWVSSPRSGLTPCMSRAPRATSIRPLDADEDIGAARGALDIQGVKPDLGELTHDVLRARPLSRAGTVAIVARVDPDQIAADTDGFGLGSQCVRHAPHPSSRFGFRWSCVLSFPLVAGAPTSTCTSPCPGGGMADALA